MLLMRVQDHERVCNALENRHGTGDPAAQRCGVLVTRQQQTTTVVPRQSGSRNSEVDLQELEVAHRLPLPLVGGGNDVPNPVFLVRGILWHSSEKPVVAKSKNESQNKIQNPKPLHKTWTASVIKKSIANNVIIRKVDKGLKQTEAKRGVRKVNS